MLNSANIAIIQSNRIPLYGGVLNHIETYFQLIKENYGQSFYDQLWSHFSNTGSYYADSLKILEWHMYGSSRIGICKSDALISVINGNDLDQNGELSADEYISSSLQTISYNYTSYSFYRGLKNYELTNHLGNVLVVVSDRKINQCNSGVFIKASAVVVSATDYSPFGAPLAGRTWQASEYRFSFNGKELDKEGMGGGGNTYDYGFRIYNPQLGKFLSVDPLLRKFPWYTPYQFAGNTPIAAIDLDGLEELLVIRWYDGDNFMGVTYFRIMNASDRLPGHQSGGDGLYVNLDHRLKGAVEQQLKNGTWKPTFFNVSNNTPNLGIIRNTLTNQKDKDARNNLQLQNEKAGREGDNAILFGRPTETVFFEQNSSEYSSDITVDGNNVSNDDAVKASKLFIKANPDYSVAVVGSANTDNASGNYNNQKLSEDRANMTLSQLTTGVDAVPATKLINNGGVGPSAASVGRTSQGTKELNRNAKVNFIIPKQP